MPTVPHPRALRSPRRPKRARRIALVLILAGGLVGPSARAATVDEVKAVLLLGFAQLSEWSALDGTKRDFSLCIFGARTFSDVVRRAAEGEAVGAHPIAVRDVPANALPDACDLLYVPADAADAYRRLHEAGAPDGTTARPDALVVGERPEFARGLGAVHLFVDGGRLRFEIDRAAALRAGARMSSRILRRGQLVDDEGGA